MDYKDVKTSHDLADVLESVANLLRSIPEYELGKVRQNFKDTDNQKNSEEPQIQITLTELASRLSEFGRENAETELKKLTLESMRHLATSLKIRIPSKASKADTINILLTQLFDIPAGQERIRTFHNRNVKS